MSDDKLLFLCQKIDVIDVQIFDLLNQCVCVVQEVGYVKVEINVLVFCFECEVQVLCCVVDCNFGFLLGIDIQIIFCEVMLVCCVLEKCVVVVYFGLEGIFSEQVVYQQFGYVIEGLFCVFIDEVFCDVEVGIVDFGVVFIENFFEGVINWMFDLLLQIMLIISGEVVIFVYYSLMIVSGKMEGIICICVYLQVFVQCNVWFNQNYFVIECQVVVFNVEVVCMVGEDKSVVVIVGEIVGQKYSLQMVNVYIQDDLYNCICFVVIGCLCMVFLGCDQIFIVLLVFNKVGVVYNLFVLLVWYGVLMMCFELCLVCMGVWEYYFYVDFEGYEQDEKVVKVFEELCQNVVFFKLLGFYLLGL